MEKENLDTSYQIMIIIIVFLSTFIIIINLQEKAFAQNTTTPLSISYQYINQWGTKGSDPGQFLYPNSIAVDSSGNVYVSDNGNSRIQKFDSNGNLLTKWDLISSEEGHIVRPAGIAIDQNNNIYVKDYYTNSIIKFDSNGNLLTKWGSFGSANGQFIGSGGIAVNSIGNVFVADGENNRIQVFIPILSKDIPNKDISGNTNSTTINKNRIIVQPGVSTQI